MMSRTDACRGRASRIVAAGCLAAWVVVVAACRQDMHDQPKYKPLEASSFVEDGRASRPLVPGTVARDDLGAGTPFYTGRLGNTLVATSPIPVTRRVLARGQERYDIFCAPCHDRVGGGRGVIVRRGLRPPPSLHIDRLRQAPVGHFFDVMTRGFGAMADYAAQVSPRDRWAIAAYIRALQLSQRATLADVPMAKRRDLRVMER
jgi:hypothetical protein